jgi:hypothetical protein
MTQTLYAHNEFKKKNPQPGMETYAYNPNTWVVEAGGLQVPG